MIPEFPKESLDKTFSITRRAVVQMTANHKENDKASKVRAGTMLEQSRRWLADRPFQKTSHCNAWLS